MVRGPRHQGLHLRARPRSPSSPAFIPFVLPSSLWPAFHHPLSPQAVTQG